MVTNENRNYFICQLLLFPVINRQCVLLFLIPISIREVVVDILNTCRLCVFLQHFVKRSLVGA